jgi:hypothetical protein
LAKESKPYVGEKTASSTIGARRTGCLHIENWNCLSPCTNINSKWIKDPNVSTKTLQVVQERIENKLEHLGIGNIFLNRTPVAQQIWEGTNGTAWN